MFHWQFDAHGFLDLDIKLSAHNSSERKPRCAKDLIKKIAKMQGFPVRAIKKESPIVILMAAITPGLRVFRSGICKQGVAIIVFLVLSSSLQSLDSRWLPVLQQRKLLTDIVRQCDTDCLRSSSG